MELRLFQVIAVCCLHAILLAPALLVALTAGRNRVDAVLGEYLRRVLAQCGGAFPKFGQVLSTRPDLLPAETCAQLSGLQDQMPAIRPARLSRLITAAFPVWPFEQFDPLPVACATIAQVHTARLAGGPQVALKIMRPRVRERIDLDCQVARALSPLLGLVPVMRSVPLAEILEDVGRTLRRQTDFCAEAANLSRLHKDFQNYSGVFVPELYPEFCSSNVLCLEYVGGLKRITDPSIPDRQARELVRLGLHSLYHMIFETGFLHCDLHPGNLMTAPDGRLVILDMGLMTELDPSTQRSFGEFFAAIALRKGLRAAEIVRSTALRVPPTLDCASFDRDISDLVERSGGLSAEQFNVAAFVTELFEIQGRHGIFGASRFSLIILSLLIYEGIAKQRYPDLDFQAEAIPFVLASLLTNAGDVPLGVQ
jgi:ubiquinone biosynthesis protein